MLSNPWPRQTGVALRVASSLSRAALVAAASFSILSCLKADTGTAPETGLGSNEYTYLVVPGSLNLYPNFTVTVNGVTRGRVTQGFSYFSRTCATASTLSDAQLVRVPVKVGDTVTIHAVFASKRFFYWNNLSPTIDDLRARSCEWLDVPEEPFNPTLDRKPQWGWLNSDSLAAPSFTIRR